MSLIKKLFSPLGAAKPRFMEFWKVRPKFHQGFTLIELTVVLFLVGLLFFTAMPKLGNFLFQSDLKSVARSLKSTVHFLRSKSIATHKYTVLNIDLGKGRFWGTYETEETDTQPFSAQPPLVSPKRLPKGIKVLDAYNMNTEKMRFGLLRSTFNPKGVVEETVLHLADSRDRVFTIIINAFTGRFLIYDEYVDVEYAR